MDSSTYCWKVLIVPPRLQFSENSFSQICSKYIFCTNVSLCSCIDAKPQALAISIQRLNLLSESEYEHLKSGHKLSSTRGGAPVRAPPPLPPAASSSVRSLPVQSLLLQCVEQLRCGCSSIFDCSIISLPVLLL